MKESNLKYEPGFKVAKKEENYIIETINDFVELTNAEYQTLQEIILKNRENRLRG